MQAIVAAALAGLLATPHCAGMCGGFAVACARTPVQIGGARPDRLRAGLWAWHAGRIGTYAALGGLAGFFGGAIPGPSWLPAALSAVLLIWFAAALAGVVPQPTARIPGLARAGQWIARKPSAPARVLFGAVTGLLPCGMVYAALSIAIAAGSPLYGAAAMAVFGLATVPGLTVLALGVHRYALRGRWSRRAAAAAVLVLGLWSVGMRGFSDGPHRHGDPATSPSHQHNAAPAK
jgi:uncharacterized protein